jgi:hypothetical protein
MQLRQFQRTRAAIEDVGMPVDHLIGHHLRA